MNRAELKKLKDLELVSKFELAVQDVVFVDSGTPREQAHAFHATLALLREELMERLEVSAEARSARFIQAARRGKLVLGEKTKKCRNPQCKARAPISTGGECSTCGTEDGFS